MPLGEGGFLVLTEVDGSGRGGRAAARGGAGGARRGRALDLGAEAAAEIAALWRWRDGVSLAVQAERGGKVSEDIVVPFDRLAEAIDETLAIGARHDLAACSWGHAGDGNLHSTFLIDPADEDERPRAGARPTSCSTSPSGSAAASRASTASASSSAAGSAPVGAGRGRAPPGGEDGVRPQGPAQPGEEAIARPRVHVTGSVPAVVTEALEQDFELVTEPAGADGVLALLTTKVDGDYLDGAGSQLAIVANYAVGVDNIDLDAARGRGVQIANTPDVLTKATAELAIALTLALLRRVAEGDRFIRERATWTFSLEFMLGEGLDGKTFAVVGPGRIGREAARLAEAFGARSGVRRPRRRPRTPCSRRRTSSACTAR